MSSSKAAQPLIGGTPVPPMAIGKLLSPALNTCHSRRCIRGTVLMSTHRNVVMGRLEMGSHNDSDIDKIRAAWTASKVEGLTFYDTA